MRTIVEVESSFLPKGLRKWQTGNGFIWYESLEPFDTKLYRIWNPVLDGLKAFLS